MSEPFSLQKEQPGRERAVRWTARDIGAIVRDRANTAPVIGDGDFVPVADIAIWDAWPVQQADGLPAVLGDGSTLWMALGAPHFADPEERHGHARIHLLQRRGERWRHLGPAMPEGFSPGSREWSGSAVLSDDGRDLTLYFTATGELGEQALTFRQRLFSARATLAGGPEDYRLVDWRGLEEIVERDPALYMASDAGGGEPGTVKAFRDPAWFRDPREGRDYIFFTGSRAGSASAYNGVIGAAVFRDSEPSGWSLLPPLVCADTFNNELERPHAIFRDGLYYLFWSTQQHVFNPAGPAGPTGLYGMVSAQLDHGWKPLNGSGLVFANPPEAPRQAYSWLVLADLTVISFVDSWGQAGTALPRRFGATFAPELRLELDGPRAGLVR